MKNSRVFLFAICIIVFAGQLLMADTTKQDMAELTRISKLEAHEYIIQRDLFIKSRTEPLDLSKAIEKGWEEGLLALIINARIAEPRWFQDWANSDFGVNRRGDIIWHPVFEDSILNSPARDRVMVIFDVS